MKRSFGITISAVIAFVGSGAALLGATLIFLAISIAPVAPSQPPFLKYGTYFFGMLWGALAIWGTVSGVGLLRLRKWARDSLLVFSCILLVVFVPGLIISFVMPISIPPNASDPERFRQTMAGMRIFIEVFNGMLIALSTFWLWFFNKHTIREQFGGGQQPDSFDAHTPRRPLSISIIACILLLGTFTFPVIFFLRFPVFLLGFFLSGRGAAMIWLALCLLQVVMGVGLLRLQAWARMTSIYYFAFFTFNSLAILLIPGSQARFQIAQAEILSRLAPTIGSVPYQGHFPMWFGLVSALPFLGVQLWFLIKNKPAFGAPVQQPSN
jgi:hypothetical protein